MAVSGIRLLRSWREHDTPSHRWAFLTAYRQVMKYLNNLCLNGQVVIMKIDSCCSIGLKKQRLLWPGENQSSSIQGVICSIRQSIQLSRLESFSKHWDVHIFIWTVNFQNGLRN